MSTLTQWQTTPCSAGASSPQSCTGITLPAGSQRMLIIAVTAYISNTDTSGTTVTVTYGGGNAAIPITNGSTSGRRFAWFGYIPETDLGLLTDGNNYDLSVTVTPSGTLTVNGFQVNYAFYGGVDQTGGTTTFPSSADVYLNSGTGGTCSVSVTNVAGGNTVFALGGTNANMTFTNPTATFTPRWDNFSTVDSYGMSRENTSAGAETVGVDTDNRAGCSAVVIAPNSVTDSTPPVTGTVNVSPDVAAAYTSAAPTITATLTDPDSPVTACEYTTNGTTWVSGTVSGASSPWTCTGNPTGLSGSLTINVRGTSAGGTNTAGGTAINRTVDTTGPTDGTLNATAASSSQIDLGWTAASDSGSGLAAANTYKVVRATGATAPADCSGASVYTGTALSFSDAGLGASTQYSYRVCAYDNMSNVSAGATASATTQAGGVCTHNPPTVSITPVSRNVGQGTSGNYTLTVTNNDTGSCGASTFNLSWTNTPTMPNADFSTTGQAATIGPISPGASSPTLTFTHAAAAGATIGATQQTSVSASDANHTAVASNNVTSTASAPAPVPAGNWSLYLIVFAAIVAYGIFRHRRQQTAS